MPPRKIRHGSSPKSSRPETVWPLKLLAVDLNPGPDGPGYYRKVGSVGGYEKLNEGCQARCQCLILNSGVRVPTLVGHFPTNQKPN
jgi:hypothetical protein